MAVRNSSRSARLRRAAAALRRLSSIIPPPQSRPAASQGAGEASVATRDARSGCRAANARTWGPPPDTPNTGNRERPSASAIAAMSSAASTTRRSGLGVEFPNPGRS